MRSFLYVVWCVGIDEEKCEIIFAKKEKDGKNKKSTAIDKKYKSGIILLTI